MARIFDVLVVGAGPAGLLLGAGLARHGMSVAIIDPGPAEAIETAPSDGRNIALLAGSRATMERLGVWRCLSRLVETVREVEVTDPASAAAVHYDTSAHGTGAFGYGIEPVDLRRGLLEACRSAPRPPRFVQGEAAAVVRERDQIRLELTDGSWLAAKLLVGADGRQSIVRKLAGIDVERWDYAQRGLTAVLQLAEPHGSKVREWLLPTGPLALLPLRGRRAGLTWAMPSDDAVTLAAKPAAELIAAIAAATSGGLRPLAIESGPTTYPLGALHAHRYVGPRLALVGDAAHGVHPIHAQGFNMGVADIGVLVETLVACRRRGMDIGSGEALLPYARRRRGDNTQRLWLTDSLLRLTTNRLPPVRIARGLVLGALEHIAPLKRLAVRHGMQTG